ncbi:MAG: rhodanese-like domain-containing protein [Deltaproteobacteria bacterium]|nr:rhodanese-like domain-containing protein [Deltaproteobacteria bacterium]
MTKKYSFLMGGLMGIAALALVGCGQSWSGKELELEKTSVTLSQEVSRGGYKLVTTPELKGWIDQKKPMMIIDTMPLEDSYRKNHIPGAVQYEFPIPEVKEMDDAAKAKFEKFLGPDKDKTLVFYCGFVKCTRSHNGALGAVKLGYQNVYRHPGGIKAWMETDYPVAKVDK